MPPPVDLLGRARVGDRGLSLAVALYQLQVHVALVAVVRVADGLGVVVLEDLVHAGDCGTVEDGPVPVRDT